ncbi:hypothetical protein [Qipengyuania sp.]|uniref:hypothetical protein n=1 Tax=Qipengyuania sp. TaxID=2004515 RepID=UPI0035C78EAE
MTKAALTMFVAVCVCRPALAQEQIIGPPAERVDILAPPPQPAPVPDRACLRRQESAEISGEIVVCAEREAAGPALYDRDAARSRYAERTRNAGTIATPDVAGAGIFRGKPTFALPAPVPALIIDVTALPEAPPGSDADRIGRGLAPLGAETERAAPEPQASPAEPVATPLDGERLSPAGSAEPAAPQ